MRYLTIIEVLVLHERIIVTSGGSPGIRDFPALESSLAQPMATFDSEELYPDLVAKAAALGFFLVANHPFVDGNKRVGHAAMEVFLVLNGFEIEANVDEQEQLILDVAAGKLNRIDLEQWLRAHSIEKKRSG
jgi:death on curing protein